VATPAKPKPTVFIIFGGTGDLNKRKITPALYNLFLDGWLPAEFAIIGTGRTELTDEQFRDNLLEGINQFSRKGKAEKAKWKEFSEHITYQISNIKEAKAYAEFAQKIHHYQQEWQQEPCIVYYLAVSPGFFPVIAENIAKSKLAGTLATTRIVIEKPFGRDLESARQLNALLGSTFEESQIYRIDHYLGKETVQNILAFRFANALFEHTWNRNYIDHVQISVSEQLGVGSRGDFYETAGALRDMVQNHLFQLLCLVAMEPPVSYQADEIRNRKVDVLNALRTIHPHEVNQVAVRGQYGAGWIEGEKEIGYRQEEDVADDSTQITFAAVKLFIDNWRWQGVPFYLRTGKRLSETDSVITIQFKPVPHHSFPPEATANWQPNRLILNIQPCMGIRMQFQAKRPGLEMMLHPVEMQFTYTDFEKAGEPAAGTPEAYETLLLDITKGDSTLFMRADQVEAAWRVLMPIIDAWEATPAADFPNYEAGTRGPAEADALIAKDGHSWLV
jgi:glucose-6-phosphate 1-dehydrogenase